MNPRLGAGTSRRVIYYAAVAVTVVGLAVMFALYPYAFDDYAYMGSLGITSGGLPDIIDIDHLKRNIAYRFYCDNLRLANMTAIFVLAWPKWLSAVVSALLTGAALLLSARAARLRDTACGSMALLCAMFMALLPWYDSIAAVDYQLNYVWGTALWALATYLFLRPGRLPWIAAIAVGLVFGVWHEGLSGPALAGLGLLWLCRKDYRTASRTFMLICLATGIFVLAAVPGTKARMGLQSSPFEPYNLVRTAIALLPVWIFAATAVVAAVSGRKPWKSPVFIAMTGMCLGGIAVKFVGDDMRAAWGADLAGCLGTVWMIADTAGRNISRKVSSTVAVVLVALTGTHLATACALAFDARDEYRAVTTHQISGNTSDVLYLDIKSPVTVPFIALGKPLWSMWRWTPYAKYFGIDESRIKSTVICPPQLRRFTPAMSSRTLPGGIMEADGHFVRLHDATDTVPFIEEYILETPLFAEPVPVKSFPFRSEADGVLYDYLFPALAPPYLRPVTGLVPTGRKLD